jgi:ribosomal protein S18 acetylase RimI-like enzyme
MIQGMLMPIMVRQVRDADIASLAAIRAGEWETAAFWQARIEGYLRGEHSPQKALPARIAFIAEDEGAVVGFVSGHRTSRYGCDGELQWINVAKEHRGRGIAGALLESAASWFVQQQALRVCVNVDPTNSAAIALYKKFGAQPLNEHWLVWADISVVLGKTK